MSTINPPRTPHASDEVKGPGSVMPGNPLDDPWRSKDGDVALPGRITGRGPEPAPEVTVITIGRRRR